MKKKILLIIATFILGVVVMLYGFWFIYTKTIIAMAILVVLVVLFCILYSCCIRRTTLSEGYTLIQAFLFYRKCKQIGVDSSDPTEKNIEILRRITKDQGFTKDLDEEGLQKLYQIGKEVDSYL